MRKSLNAEFTRYVILERAERNIEDAEASERQSCIPGE